MTVKIELTSEEMKAIKTHFDPWQDKPEKEPTTEEIENLLHFALKSYLNI